MLHVRYNGESYDFDMNEIGASVDMSDGELKEKAAQQLDIDILELDGMVVDKRPGGDVVIRPEAVYG